MTEKTDIQIPPCRSCGGDVLKCENPHLHVTIKTTYAAKCTECNRIYYVRESITNAELD